MRWLNQDLSSLFANEGKEQVQTFTHTRAEIKTNIETAMTQWHTFLTIIHAVWEKEKWYAIKSKKKKIFVIGLVIGFEPFGTAEINYLINPSR